MSAPLKPGGDLDKRLVRMRCAECGNERGLELPHLFTESRGVCMLLDCHRCRRFTLHNLVGAGKVELFRA